MDTDIIKAQIVAELDRLTLGQLQEVLDFIRALTGTRRKGVLGRDLMHHVGSIPPDDLALMAQAIEEGCERIDPETWDIELS